MAAIGKSSSPRVHWDAVHGWVVDTAFPLTRAAVQACVDFTKKMQGDRIRTWPRGDRREQAEKALSMLSTETLKQNILPRSPWEKDRIIY